MGCGFQLAGVTSHAVIYYWKNMQKIIAHYSCVRVSHLPVGSSIGKAAQSPCGTPGGWGRGRQ